MLHAQAFPGQKKKKGRWPQLRGSGRRWGRFGSAGLPVLVLVLALRIEFSHGGVRSRESRHRSARLVRVSTDHEWLAHAARRGHAKSWAYNEALRRLRSLFPQTRFVFRFIPGKTDAMADWVGAAPFFFSTSGLDK